ncbi:LysR family transcriptional regulator [Streptomyces sp. NBC_00038]|uniref:LysR family transcriptional regulator n=1 Tax=Streptomyces sp. NBC_00038 TaxID=2903615 RepID=UPI002252B1F2|nr:LysR family transcriptional regulator [Streptomyces sp. NBC_00038]MCX5559795.1 LysR family transcriptional regulator [Streptomyces sp. NBC_00038]
MELRLLVTFEKVATMLSFTQAAAELKYAQSSVTSQIRALESSLGAELFDRLGSRIRLTEAGERLLPYARQIIELAEEARAAVVGAGEPSGALTVGTMESLTAYRLLPLLELFHHRYPGVRLSLRTTIGDETRQALRQGTYDVGFLMERETEHAGLETAVLAVEPLALVAAPGHRLANTPVATADLVRESLLATEPGCAYRDLFELELNSLAQVAFTEFGTIEATKRAAAAGLGIALLPEVTVAAELADGSLLRLPWEVPFTLRTQLAWRAGKRLPAHVRLFVEQARRLVREQSSGA